MSDVLDEGPFFHGTKADLRVGELLTAGFRSNYRPEVVMNHIYFTAVADGAGLAAELAAGDGEPRVYAVEPTGAFEDDPNVTDKKFPGNPTRSYRSREPLRVVGEVTDWTRLTPEALEGWRVRLAAILEDEHGALPWPGLRALLGDEPWADAVRTLMDGAEVLPAASADELQAALAQADAAERRREADALLGRI